MVIYLIRAWCVNTELVTAHLVILTLVNILTRRPVGTKQEPVRAHAEHLQEKCRQVLKVKTNEFIISRV